MYPKPAFFNANGNELLLNCGLCRERGTVRTSTTRDTSCTCSKRMNSASVRVEWPTVSTTGKSLVPGFNLRDCIGLLFCCHGFRNRIVRSAMPLLKAANTATIDSLGGAVIY